MVTHLINWIIDMKIETFCDFNQYITDISIEIYDEDYNADAVNPAEIPFPQCKIMQVGHHRFFTNRSTMPRDFKLDGDEMIKRRDSEEFPTFWVPLSPEDDWCAIIEKTAELSRLSGDRHHTRLEGYSVAGDILIPNFGS